MDAIRPHFIVPRAVKAWIIANFANFDMTTFSIEISQIFFFKFCSRIFSNISIGIVTQIGGSFDHFPYFFDSIEYRFRFTLVSYEIKRMSHVGTNFCHLELLLAHCESLSSSISISIYFYLIITFRSFRPLQCKVHIYIKLSCCKKTKKIFASKCSFF